MQLVFEDDVNEHSNTLSLREFSLSEGIVIMNVLVCVIVGGVQQTHERGGETEGGHGEEAAHSERNNGLQGQSQPGAQRGMSLHALMAHFH